MLSAADPVVWARGLTKRFDAPGGVVTALAAVDLDLPARSLAVVAGPSGSGKSTLLMMIAAAERPDAGDVEVGGRSLTRLTRRQRRLWRRDRLGLVLATPADNLSDEHDALDNVVWASSLRGEGAVRLTRSAAAKMLDELDLGHVGALRRREMSGGEQQRLAFVCAMVGPPAIIVADEPTASLDAASAEHVVRLARTIADRGSSLVIATHDQRVVDAADHVIRLEHGRRVA